MNRREFMQLGAWALFAAAFPTISPNPTAAAPVPPTLPSTTTTDRGARPLMTMPFAIGRSEKVFMPVIGRD